MNGIKENGKMIFIFDNYDAFTFNSPDVLQKSFKSSICDAFIISSQIQIKEEKIS
jgi:anthranilate/para-aminobenzoate synthase component II